MVDQLADKASSGRGAIAERLVVNLLEYSQRFFSRHNLHTVEIVVQLHEGRVVKVAHGYASAYPLRRAARDGEPTALAHGGERCPRLERHLAPGDLNTRLATRLDRLLRHFEVRFGALEIKVGDDGGIKTFRPSPPLRPAEMKKLARFFGGTA